MSVIPEPFLSNAKRNWQNFMKQSR
jgi:hypothetical protein